MSQAIVDISTILFHQSVQVLVSLKHIVTGLTSKHFIKRRIFLTPFAEVATQTRTEVEHFCQWLFDVFSYVYVLLPRVKSLNQHGFIRPCLKMPYCLFNNVGIFLISFFEIVLELIRVKSLPHKDIGHRIDFRIPLYRYFICDIFNVILIPVLTLVYTSKSWLHNSFLDPYQNIENVMLSGNELTLPLP